MKRLYLISLFVFNISQSLFSQKVNTDTSKLNYTDSLLVKANQYSLSNPDSSAYFSNMVLEFSKTSNAEIPMADALLILSRYDALKGNIESALLRLKQAIDIYNKNNMKAKTADCYKMMAITVSKLGKFNDEIIYYKKAYAIYNEINNTQGIASTLLNMSTAYIYLKDYNKGLGALSESRKYLELNSNTWFYLYLNYGVIYSKLNKNYLAKLNLDSSIAIARRKKMIDSEVTAITCLASFYKDLKDYKSATRYYLNAISMAKVNQLPIEESEALKELILCYVYSGDYKNAYESQIRYNYISDSLFDIEKINSISAIETKLGVSEKEKIIFQQNLKIERDTLEQEKNSKRLLLLIGGASILLLGLILTLVIYNRAKRANILISKQKREVELQKENVDRLNTLNQKIFSVISHDFKGPLITLQVLIDLLENKNISKDEFSYYIGDVKNQVGQSNQIIENLLNWARTELKLSRHKTLISKPYLIVEDIKKELNFMATKKSIQISNSISENIVFTVPEDILKIIVRNLISNALKFSYEHNKIEIGFNDQKCFFVKDYGVGLKNDELNLIFTGKGKSNLGTFNETGFGLGLYITFELINKFDGSIWVERNQPNGSIFMFTLPLHENN
jgi:signal transduction histidine kinase